MATEKRELHDGDIVNIIRSHYEGEGHEVQSVAVGVRFVTAGYKSFRTPMPFAEVVLGQSNG